MDPFGLMLGLGGIGANFFGQSQTNQMQAQMMQQQQSFQERMSSTAYQRASADMQAAGLNPMMMFSSGSAASTPAGASPSPNVKSGLDADAMQKAISTAVQSRVANATIDNLVEQNAKIKAEAATERTRPAFVIAQTSTEREKPHNIATDTALKQWEIPIIRNRAVTSQNEESMNATARRILDVGAYGGKKVSDTISPVGEVLHSAKNARATFSDRFHW